MPLTPPRISALARTSPAWITCGTPAARPHATADLSGFAGPVLDARIDG
jgi:hypothetical protein